MSLFKSVTLLDKKIINSIRNVENLGVYCYLMSQFQSSGMSFLKKQVIEMICDYGLFEKDLAQKILNELIEVDSDVKKFISDL